LLNIVLTTKDFGSGYYAFAGFPLSLLDHAIRRLVREEHRTVALCEEFKVFRSNGIDFDIERRVVRLITPGTLVDESFLDPKDNNFLLSIAEDPESPKRLGLAWMDLTNGEFYAETVDYNFDVLADHCFRISPREVLVDDSLRDKLDHPLRAFLSSKRYFVATASLPKTIPRAHPNQTAGEAAAVSLLSSHVNSTMLESKPSLSSPSGRPSSLTMHLTSAALRGLEIRVNSYEGGVRGTLLSLVDKTQTKGGYRLLFQRLGERIFPKGKMPSGHLTFC
jgi:DNA mismatch repair ATPase MutS